MVDKKKSEAVGLLNDIEHFLHEATPIAMADSLTLHATQRNAVMSGLSAATVGIDKAVKGLTGKYIPTKRAAKPAS